MAKPILSADQTDPRESDVAALSSVLTILARLDEVAQQRIVRASAVFFEVDLAPRSE